MWNELTPLIKRLKKWRADNELTQDEAVNVFKEQGLPITLDTLQNWEIGRRAPRGLSAVALNDFLIIQKSQDDRLKIQSNRRDHLTTICGPSGQSPDEGASSFYRHF